MGVFSPPQNLTSPWKYALNMRRTHRRFQDYFSVGSSDGSKDVQSPSASENQNEKSPNVVFSLLLRSWCRRQKPEASDQPETKPTYFIISDVESVAPNNSGRDRVLQSIPVAEENKARHRFARIRAAFERCWNAENVYDYEVKDIETISMVMEDVDLSLLDDDESSTINETAETHDTLSGLVFGPSDDPSRDKVKDNYPSQMRRLVQEETSIPSLQRLDEEEEGQDVSSSEDQADRRDDQDTLHAVAMDRESMAVFFHPVLADLPIDPNRHVLGVTFPHPASLIEQDPVPNIASRVHSTHAPFPDREGISAFEVPVVDSKPIPDRDPPLSPISDFDEESFPKTIWANPSPVKSTITGTIDLEEDKENAANSSRWTTKLYQPIFRIAREFSCGKMRDNMSTFEEAPFDELQIDLERSPFDEVATDLGSEDPIDGIIVMDDPIAGGRMTWPPPALGDTSWNEI